MDITSNFDALPSNYLFAQISKQVAEFKQLNPSKHIYKLGIGDISLPLAPIVAQAMQTAAETMANKDSVIGYGEYAGLGTLRQSISTMYHTDYNVTLEPSEVFVVDGAKSVFMHIMDILDFDTALIVDPVYPVYRDSCLLKGKSVQYLEANMSNDYLPLPNNNTHASLIYLCSPNNPTGSVYDTNALGQWVDYAISNDALIIFDAAYKDYIQDEALPRSIYSIKGSDKCAIEVCSLSKNAGFTGLRCGYVIVPHALTLHSKSVNQFWLRFLATNTNGVSYVVQEAALAALSAEGQRYNKQCVNYYMHNASIITAALSKANANFCGGINAPYVWLQCPHNQTSMQYFEYLLNNLGIVSTAGIGFGNGGQNFVRLSSFGTPEDTASAIALLLSSL